MRIIFFNVNDASIDSRGIKDFICSNKDTTDVFCFQEAFNNMQSLCNELLPGYQKVHSHKFITVTDEFSQITLVKEPFKIKHVQVIKESTPDIGPGLYTLIDNGTKVFHVVNFHGISRPVDKKDCPQRIEQSVGVIEYLKDKNGPRIIGGDFNSDLDTESVQMFEKNGYRNLVKEFNIKSTRNEVVWKKYPASKQYYSDYAFVTPEVKVRKFNVPYTEISDHLPLILEVE